MNEGIFSILCYVVVFGFLIVREIVWLKIKKAKGIPPDNDPIYKRDDSQPPSKADVDYINKLIGVVEQEEDGDQLFSVECPNCGAPLKVIYERCEYCGSAYKELKDLPSQKGKKREVDESCK